MRTLGLKDAFAFARIIKAANIRSEIVTFANEISNRKKVAKEDEKVKELNVEDVGFEFFITLITSISSADVEKKIYELYADIKGCTVEDASLTDFTTLKNDIKELIEKNDLKAFFQSASVWM